MYGLAGERRLTEWEVDWLPGYADSRPVRIGNAAHQQFQLDVYGEVMDAFEQSRKGGLAVDRGRLGAAARAGRACRRSLGRARQRHLGDARAASSTSSIPRSMAWVGLRPRHQGASSDYGLEGPVEKWREVRDAIRAEVCDKGFDAERNTFRAAYGSDHARCQPAAAGAGRLRRSPTIRASSARSRRSSASLLRRRLRACATDTHDDRRRPAARRRRLPRLQLLAGRRLCLDRPPGRRREAVRAPARRSATTSACSPRNTTRAAAPAGRQLPAGLLPRRPDQHRLQPDAAHQAAGAARQRSRCSASATRQKAATPWSGRGRAQTRSGRSRWRRLKP